MDHLRREKLRKEKIEPALRSASPSVEKEALDFSEDRIQDSQLRMIFALCHPSLDEKARVILALKILCGFTNQEIAAALLSKLDTINKRLYRGKKALREEEVTLAYPTESELAARLGTVLRVLYLLFNEGYYASQDAQGIRRDLCREAIRLCLILASSHLGDLVEAYALLALMCFHASRLEARQGMEGEWILLAEQDATRWDHELIQRGEYYLNLAAQGNRLSKYHLEAAIAYWHTKSESAEKWTEILKYYNLLLQVEYSPVAALNRTFALSKVHGAEKAISEALRLKLEGQFFYQVLLGYLFSEQKDSSQAKAYYQRALGLARTEQERVMVR
ncbi:MAG: DUF6596 domain-containing protein, partial [Bacteroidota bacterium]